MYPFCYYLYTHIIFHSMETLFIIIGCFFAVLLAKKVYENQKKDTYEAEREQFSNPTPSEYKPNSYTENDEDDGSYVDDVYDDIKAKPNSRDSWLGLSEEEMEEVYYRLKADKIKLSDTMYKHIANIIGEQYEDDLLEELQCIDKYSISNWLDEKRREKRFLTSKVWRKIKTIQRNDD